MQNSSSSGASRDKSGIVVGLALLALAGVLWFDAVNLASVVSYGVGPAVMPKIIAAGLVVLGLLSLLSGWRSAAPDLEEIDLQPVGVIIAGFIALTAIIGLGGGFIPAMVVLFVSTSAAFGRRALLADAALGFTVALCIYLLFSKLLTLTLPLGPLERLIG